MASAVRGIIAGSILKAVRQHFTFSVGVNQMVTHGSLYFRLMRQGWEGRSWPDLKFQI
jgi:hypothetical protein